MEVMTEKVEMIPLFRVCNGMVPVYSTVQEGFDLASVKDNFAYIIDNKGWKILKRTKTAFSLLNISEVTEFPALEENLDLATTKIPWELVQKVTAFFTAVYQKSKTEAVGYLYYKAETGEWDFIPPVQSATSASAAYNKAPIKEREWVVAGTIHSHGSMSAFHSGTDQHDEQYFDGVHITIGKVDGSNPEYSCSLVAQGARTKFNKLEDLVEAPPESATPDWLQTWMSAIKLSPLGTWEFNKLSEKIQKKVDRLYSRYLEGKISEDTYLQDLARYTKDDNEALIDADAPEWPLLNGMATHAVDDDSMRPVKPYKNALGFLDVRRYNRWSR